MFQLTNEEWALISSQFVMTSRSKRPKSALPLVFTEHGALMLSSVLKSELAIDISVKITRAFVAMRTLIQHTAIPAKISELENSITSLRSEINEILANYHGETLIVKYYRNQRLYEEEIVIKNIDVSEKKLVLIDRRRIKLNEIVYLKIK